MQEYKFLDLLVDFLIKYQVPTHWDLEKYPNLIDYGSLNDMFIMELKPQYMNYLLQAFRNKNKNKTLDLRPLSTPEILSLPRRIRGAAEYFLLKNNLTGQRTIFFLGPYIKPIGIIPT